MVVPIGRDKFGRVSPTLVCVAPPVSPVKATEHGGEKITKFGSKDNFVHKIAFAVRQYKKMFYNTFLTKRQFAACTYRKKVLSLRAVY